MVFQDGFWLNQSYHRCNYCCIGHEGGSLIQKWDKEAVRRVIELYNPSMRYLVCFDEVRDPRKIIFAG